MASIMAREDLDHTVDATEVSFTPASWRIFSSLWISFVRASTWVFLYLVSSLTQIFQRGSPTAVLGPRVGVQTNELDA
jgi:hypothetical protein